MTDKPRQKAHLEENFKILDLKADNVRIMENLEKLEDQVKEVTILVYSSLEYYWQILKISYQPLYPDPAKKYTDVVPPKLGSLRIREL